MDLLSLGRVQEALQAARLGRDLDPLDQAVFASLAMVTWRSGAYAEGRALMETAIEKSPDNHYVAASLIIAAAVQNDWEAVERLTSPEHLAKHPLRELSATPAIAAAFRDPGAGIGQAMLGALRARTERTGHIDPTVMVFFAQMGMVDDCYDLLDARRFGPSGEKGDTLGLGAYRPPPLFSAAFPALRADPRFVRLCARLGLVEYWLATQNWPDCADEVPYDFRAECERHRDYPKDVYLS